ncbi:MAG TPA: rhodanese-like domain-containing protein [Lutibacter sp.]|nr:rhodanese-like domain-containing protein [Lutibacter sp.]
MKSIRNSIVVLLLISVLFSCSNTNFRKQPVGKIVDVDSIIKNRQGETLAELYANHGNLINTKTFPAYVKAPQLNANTNNWLLVDIRDEYTYESGHINGAYNVPKEQLIDFLTEKHYASAYEKVIIIGYSGQLASYVTGVLRYAGISNVYALLHGMAAWNTDFSGVLKKNFGLNYRNMIVKSSAKKNEKKNDAHGVKEVKPIVGNLPKLKQGATMPHVLGRARALLNRPISKYLIKADTYFPTLKNNPDKYYTIYYMNQKKFDAGHIKGAHLYKSRKDLSFDQKLTNLPTDKPIVIYCKSGTTGAQATAYLNMLGYEAQNLMFGENSFSFNVFEKKISDLSSDFPVIYGEKRTDNKAVVTTGNSSKTKKVTKPIIKRKKKEVSGGCG